MYINFTKNRTIASWLIRSVTGEPYSHVVIEMNGLIYHSNFAGVNIQFSSEYWKHNTRVDRVWWPSRGIMTKMPKRGSYDFLTLFYLLFVIIGKKLHIKCNTPKYYGLWDLCGAYICTEFVMQSLDLTKDKVKYLTPGQLRALLLDRAKKV